MYAELKAEERNLRRHPTTWAAQCIVGDRVLLGTVRDVSPHGAFFQPEIGLSEGVFYGQMNGGDAGAMSQRVRLRLVYRSTPDLEAEGEICWTGVSDRHGCGGFGVRFFAPPQVVDD